MRAIATAPTATPAFAPAESDEEDDGKFDSFGWDVLPVGEMKLEGVGVGKAGTDVRSEAYTPAVLVIDIVGLTAKPMEFVAKPGTSTAELTARTQRACHHSTA
ncbi:hypothetical protein E8E13_004423 [Curvularia kusanoi]|uniref:Uncharacterized protein n=1 Tax=Curvularia kusanoi TaxID=90978 RepID=A0A9P4TNC1_CURKU|nr:hypothetical protein E8E13_004423 [Curvularia kusanoi]